MMPNPEIVNCTTMARETAKYCYELCFRACNTQEDVREMVALLSGEMAMTGARRAELMVRPDPILVTLAPTGQEGK